MVASTSFSPTGQCLMFKQTPHQEKRTQTLISNIFKLLFPQSRWVQRWHLRNNSCHASITDQLFPLTNPAHFSIIACGWQHRQHQNYPCDGVCQKLTRTGYMKPNCDNIHLATGIHQCLVCSYLIPKAFNYLFIFFSFIQVADA